MKGYQRYIVFLVLKKKNRGWDYPVLLYLWTRVLFLFLLNKQTYYIWYWYRTTIDNFTFDILLNTPPQDNCQILFDQRIRQSYSNSKTLIEIIQRTTSRQGQP